MTLPLSKISYTFKKHTYLPVHQRGVLRRVMEVRRPQFCAGSSWWCLHSWNWRRVCGNPSIYKCWALCKTNKMLMLLEYLFLAKYFACIWISWRSRGSVVPHPPVVVSLSLLHKCQKSYSTGLLEACSKGRANWNLDTGCAGCGVIPVWLTGAACLRQASGVGLLAFS